MNGENQERKMDDIRGSVLQPRNQRKFPIPKQVNYYILHNYALRYYNGGPEDRAKILNEISANIRSYGYIILPDELERRFKNMKAHYRRKRDDYEAGLIKTIEWEYYQILDGIFAHSKPKRTYNRIQPILNPKMAEEQSATQQPSSSSQQPSSLQPTQAITAPPMTFICNPQDLIPKVIIQTNAQVKIPENMKDVQGYKRKQVLEDIIPKEIKKEKLTPKSPDIVCLDDKNDNPLDMSLKKKVVIEFNDINDITQKLPIAEFARTSSHKHAAIKRIAEELKKLDAERINLDEQRLQLEIKRNEVDKAAYTLTQLLSQVTDA